jgi:T-complex protein 1 subunit delta
MTLDENERSIHDALCVMRALYQKRFLVPGGGAPEAEAAYQLGKVCAVARVLCICVTPAAVVVRLMPARRLRLRLQAAFLYASGRLLKRWR